MNKPSRNEIEQSLLGSKQETAAKPDRSLELPTDNTERRRSRVIGGNLGGVSRKIPKRNFTGWYLAVAMVVFSGAVFIIPEFFNDAPKISQDKNQPPANQLYTDRIEETIDEQIQTTGDNGFTVPLDRDRAAEYREAEKIQQQLDALKAQAEEAIAAGNYTRPEDKSALRYYQDMLRINANNVAATDGINYMLSRLMTVGVSHIEKSNIPEAKKTLRSIAEIDAESEEFFDLSEAITNFEIAEAQKKRDQQINRFFASAQKAIEQEKLIAPKNDNATFYFQKILALDANNINARKGLDKISQDYADLAEQHINNRDWKKAETTISNLKLASKDSALASFLEKRLAEAKLQPEPVPETPIAPNAIAESVDGAETNSTNPSTIAANSGQVDNPAPVENAVPVENIATPESTPSNDSSIPFANRQSAPAPTEDLSVNSNSVPTRESFNTQAPVRDSINTQAPVSRIDENQKQLDTGLQAYYSGEYVTAFSNLAPLADKNVTRAQIRIGYMYQFGRGVAQDTALGSQFLRKALPDLIRRAQANQSWAQSDLGSLYEDGIVVSQSYTEALSWYRKAAAQNYAGAQTNLGNMYFFGKGVEQNQDEAIKWYRLAALGGDAIAKQNLIQLNAVNF